MGMFKDKPNLRSALLLVEELNFELQGMCLQNKKCDICLHRIAKAHHYLISVSSELTLLKGHLDKKEKPHEN